MLTGKRLQMGSIQGLQLHRTGNDGDTQPETARFCCRSVANSDKGIGLPPFPGVARFVFFQWESGAASEDDPSFKPGTQHSEPSHHIGCLSMHDIVVSTSRQQE